jgi:hypothetical protein
MAVATNGGHDRAKVMTDQAEALAFTVAKPSDQVKALVAVAEAVAVIGDQDRATTLAHQAENLVSTIIDPDDQARALAALARRGDPGRARSLIAQAFSVGHWTIPLDALAHLEPTVLTAVADGLLAE